MTILRRRCGCSLLARLSAVASLALAGVALLAASAAANGVSSSQAIGWLNAQRADNGIPAGITDSAEWNEGCRLHMAWWAENPGAADPHMEAPGTPGYSTLGAFAGANAVLAEGIDWSPSTVLPWRAADPWESAPLHLMQLLAPDLSISGFSPVCMVTWAGYQRTPPAEPELLAYPGNGTSFVAASERAEEWPFTPARFVGLSQGGITGPYIYVLGWGTGDGHIISASLQGPKGAVSIKVVDNLTSSAIGDLGAYMPPGGMLIPVHPLAPARTYTASVTFAPRPLIVELPASGGEGAGPTFEITSSPGKLSPGESLTAPAPLSLRWSFKTAPLRNRCGRARRGSGCHRRR